MRKCQERTGKSGKASKIKEILLAKVEYIFYIFFYAYSLCPSSPLLHADRKAKEPWDWGLSGDHRGDAGREEQMWPIVRKKRRRRASAREWPSGRPITCAPMPCSSPSTAAPGASGRYPFCPRGLCLEDRIGKARPCLSRHYQDFEDL